MTTVKQTEANRRNAARSTGPKTAAGRSRSSQNALRHGSFSSLPVIPGLEREEDWEKHRVGILTSLAPVGALEEALAFRVALCVWRLSRTARYETAVTAVAQEAIADMLRPPPLSKRDAAFIGAGLKDDEGEEGLAPTAALARTQKKLEKARSLVELWGGTLRLLEQLPELPDEARLNGDDVDGILNDLVAALPGDDECMDNDEPAFLAALGVPREEVDHPSQWDGWTVAAVRTALALRAKEGGTTPEKLLARALRQRQDTQDTNKKKVEALDGKAKALRRQLKVSEDRLTRERILPSEALLAKITRYEAHLSRQMLQALHELQRLQAVRAGERVPAPAALDVVTDGQGGDAFQDATG